MPTATETPPHARRPQPTYEATAVTDARHRAIARVAADRARALREQAASIGTETLEPLRAALRVRAAQLELAATALGDEPVVISRRTA